MMPEALPPQMQCKHGFGGSTSRSLLVLKCTASLRRFSSRHDLIGMTFSKLFWAPLGPVISAHCFRETGGVAGKETRAVRMRHAQTV